MNLQNEKKRKGGAARLRDKNKKKLIETSKCYNIEQMFTKKPQSTITVSKFLNFIIKICFY